MRDDVVAIQSLTHRFRIGRNVTLTAVDRVSLQVRRGEILGLVGESGSGKSTLARCLMNTIRPSAGRILIDGIEVTDRAQLRAHRRELEAKRQMIFQDSNASLNPRMRVVDIVGEPLRIHGIRPERGSIREEAAFQLRYVGLDERYLDEYPDALSGGQRQRVAIARALVTEPELLIADEPIASLDGSIQAQIVNLFAHLRAEHGFSILFIAHDLAMVAHLCDRIGVMYRGRLVELAPTDRLFDHPMHAYTRALIAAIPIPDPAAERRRVYPDFDAMAFPLEGEPVAIAPDHFVLLGEEVSR